MARFDHRSECRYVADTPCLLRYKSGMGLVEVTGRLVDISARGLRLMTSADVPAKTAASLSFERWPHHTYYGSTTHSKRVMSTVHQVGFRLIDGTFPFEVLRSFMGEAAVGSSQPAIPECYRRLGLAFPSPADNVHHAFRRLAMSAHPDHGGSDKEFLELYTAYREALELCP